MLAQQEGSQLEHFLSEPTTQVYFDIHSLIQKFDIYPPDPVETPCKPIYSILFY